MPSSVLPVCSVVNLTGSNASDLSAGEIQSASHPTLILLQTVSWASPLNLPHKGRNLRRRPSLNLGDMILITSANFLSELTTR